MGREKLDGLQILRFLAALLVVLGHAIPLAEGNSRDFPASLHTELLGRIGVDLFFLVSGFIMVVSNDRRFGVDGAFAHFATRRFVRLFPVYWLFCFVAIAVIVLGSGKGVSCRVLDPGYVVASFLMVASQRCDGIMLPLLAQGWTLHYEIFFYSIFATSLFFSKTMALVYVVASILLLSLVGHFLNPRALPPTDRLAFYTNPILIFFAAGTIYAVIYERLIPFVRIEASPVVTSISTLVICLYAIHLITSATGVYPGFAVSLTSCLVFMVCMSSVGSSGNRLFQLFVMMGDATYSIYLVHNYVLTAMKKVWATLDLWSYPVAFVVCAPAIVSVVGLAIYLLLERPLTRRLHAHLRSQGLTG